MSTPLHSRARTTRAAKAAFGNKMATKHGEPTGGSQPSEASEDALATPFSL